MLVVRLALLGFLISLSSYQVLGYLSNGRSYPGSVTSRSQNKNARTVRKDIDVSLAALEQNSGWTRSPTGGLSIVATDSISVEPPSFSLVKMGVLFTFWYIVHVVAQF